MAMARVYINTCMHVPVIYYRFLVTLRQDLKSYNDRQAARMSRLITKAACELPPCLMLCGFPDGSLTFDENKTDKTNLQIKLYRKVSSLPSAKGKRVFFLCSLNDEVKWMPPIHLRKALLDRT